MVNRDTMSLSYSILVRAFSKARTVIRIFFGEIPYYYKGVKKPELIIYDNIYPHPISGFRLEEFTCLLTEFKNSKILLNSGAYQFLDTDEKLHKVHIRQLLNKHPHLHHRISFTHGFTNINTKLFYCVFLTHIHLFLEILEKYRIPFVFTLYPGADFELNDENCDAKLQKVLSSKMFRKVIVTQKITRDYLLQKNFCAPEKIVYIFGCVVPQQSLKKDITSRLYFKNGKDTLDLCFCAAKYMPQGLDKGYDVFIKLAKELNTNYDFVRFHVVGGFGKDAMDASVLGDRITFYGYQNFEQLEHIFTKMDILISPNRPFILRKGSFDGFPLGTAIEAALNGTMVMIADELKQNEFFEDQKDLIIIKSNVSTIKSEIEKLILNPGRIKEIAQAGKLKFQTVYSNQSQMNPRVEVIQNCINQS